TRRVVAPPRLRICPKNCQSVLRSIPQRHNPMDRLTAMATFVSVIEAGSTPGLKPTEAGQRFYDRAKAVIAAADDAENQARGARASLSGTLRVSAPVTFARLHVVPAVNTFLAEHPDLRLDLVLDDRRTDLLAEGIDVALRLGV